MSPVFPIALALYLTSAALYLAQIGVGVQSPGAAPIQRAARLFLIGAFLAHAVDIGIYCVHGLHPVANAREALSWIAWLMAGAYLVATWRQRLPLAGALLVPVALVLEIAARVGPTAATGRTSATLLATLHIGLAAGGIALFAVAAGDAVVYLLAERQLKGRHIPLGPARSASSLPSLEALDRLNRRCIQIGFPLFTFAVVTGAIWLSRLPPVPGEAHRLLQPQYVMAVIAWLLYAALLLLRFLLGWRGRRAAMVTLGGFAASIAVLLIYYVRDLASAGGA